MDDSGGPSATLADDGAGLPRDWQKNLEARMPTPPQVPWWEACCGNPLVVAAVAALLALVLLAVLQPPLVQKTSETSVDRATLSMPRLLIWSGVVGGLVLVAPYAYKAFCKSG